MPFVSDRGSADQREHAIADPEASKQSATLPTPAPSPAGLQAIPLWARSTPPRRSRPPIQASLRTAAPDSSLEDEAEHVARDVDGDSTGTTRVAGPIVTGGLDAPSAQAPPLTGGDAVADRLATGSSRGRPIGPTPRARLEARTGHDLSAVRVHTGNDAQAMAEHLDAHAFTVGSDIYVGAGEPGPDSAQGLHLLAHEVTHTIQQARPDGGQPSGTVAQRQPKAPGKSHQVTAVTLFVDRDVVVLELDHKSTVVLGATYNGKPPPGHYQVTPHGATPVIGGVADATGWVVRWTYPHDAKYTRAATVRFDVIAGRPGASNGAATGNGPDTTPGGAGSGSGGGQKAPGDGPKAGDGSGGGAGAPGSGRDAGTDGEADGIAGGQGQTAGAGTSEPAIRLTPQEEAIWRQMAELMKGAGTQPAADPSEMIRLFQVLRAFVVDPKFGTEGESWLKFARFLDANRDKIEGQLRSSPNGRITTEVLTKIIDEYGKFLATTPEPARVGELKTVDDFDKEFKYDPGWQKLSPADRKLLLEYAKMAPGEITDKKIDFTKITSEMKSMMAIKLADSSVLGEMAGAAKNAFTDPTFLITLVVTMAIYVGLWLTPDPSWVTKILAGTLTVVLLTQFAFSDIYGFAVAWSNLSDEATVATDIAGLKAAGDKFLKRIGPIGFDIMLFIVMWRVGKLAGPKLSKIGAERGVVRAESTLRSAEAKPGSGVAQPRPAGVADPLGQAKAKTTGTTASQVLDTLADLLPDSAREGLASFRARTSDANVLRALEGESARGGDVSRVLTERTMTKPAVEAARSEVSQARIRLARAKLIEAETITDPAVRKSAREEQFRAVRSILEQAGKLDGAEIKKAIAARDVPALIRALRVAVDALTDGVSAKDTQGALGESLARARLRVDYAGRKGIQFLSNLALVRKVAGFTSKADWLASEQARIRASEPGITDEALRRRIPTAKIYEAGGAVYEAVGELDTMVVEPGAGGLLRPVEIAEVKGGSAPPVDAAAQLAKAATDFGAINSGTSPTRIFEMTGKNTLGRDITATLDLSQSGTVKQTTFGPLDKGFNRDIGFNQPDLQGVAESILANLPPAQPITPAPLTSPRTDEKPQ